MSSQSPCLHLGFNARSARQNVDGIDRLEDLETDGLAEVEGRGEWVFPHCRPSGQDDRQQWQTRRCGESEGALVEGDLDPEDRTLRKYDVALPTGGSGPDCSEHLTVRRGAVAD